MEFLSRAHWFAEALSPNFLLHMYDIKDSQDIAFYVIFQGTADIETHLQNYYSNDPVVEGHY